MSATAGSIGYRQGLKIDSTTWGLVAGFLVLVLSAALVLALFTAPAQPARVIQRGGPIGRAAPAETAQVAVLNAVLAQGPTFTAASDRAAARAAARGGSVLQPDFGTRATFSDSDRLPPRP